MKATKAEQFASDIALLEGIRKHLSTATFTILAKPETAAKVEEVLEARVRKARAVSTTKVAYSTAVRVSDQEYALTKEFVQDVRATILAMYSNSPEILAEYGLVPRKARAPLSTEEQLIANEKREATREARHTMGPKQRLAIKGDLTGSIVVPVAGGATSIVSSSSSSASPVTATPAETSSVSVKGSAATPRS